MPTWDDATALKAIMGYLTTQEQGKQRQLTEAMDFFTPESLLHSISSWIVQDTVSHSLNQLANDHSHGGIQGRQDAAIRQMAGSLLALRGAYGTLWSHEQMIKRVEDAEEDFRAEAPHLAEQLPEAAETAREIPADSPVAKAATAIADALRQIDVSQVGPVGVLILLFWLIFFHMSMEQIAGVTLFYMVASDYFRKPD